MKKYKIKNLPKDFILDGCKLNGKYIISGWRKGFWVVDNYEDYKSGKQTKTEPVFFKDFLGFNFYKTKQGIKIKEL